MTTFAWSRSSGQADKDHRSKNVFGDKDPQNTACPAPSSVGATCLSDIVPQLPDGGRLFRREHPRRCDPTEESARNAPRQCDPSRRPTNSLASSSQLSGQAERTWCQSCPCMKHSIKMVQAGESRSNRNIGDRMRCRLQELLRVIDSNSKNLMKYRSLKLVAKGALQRSPWNPAVSDYIVHR